MTYVGKKLKLFRGKKMDKELKRLSDEQKDFEFRSLFIEENEKSLHVIESRQIVSDYISWGLMAIAVIVLTMGSTPLVSLYVFIASLFLRLLSVLFKLSYKKTSEGYKFGLSIVDSVIKQDYGISMN